MKRRPARISLVSGVALLSMLSGGAAQQPHEYFSIAVVDEATGRGIPLVELQLANRLRFHTDSNGLVAFYEPGLMGREVFFSIKSHGYEFPERFLDERGRVLRPTPGQGVVLRMRRLNLAERLYRITGEGIYHHSVLLGQTPPIKRPLLNGGVLGQDTAVATVYRGKIYWFWGDTIGTFQFNGAVSGATSELPERGGLDPGIGIDFSYFVDASGFSKAMCPRPGPGLVWLDWIVPLTDSTGEERLVAYYSKMKNLGEALERGIAIFNDEKEVFERYVDLKVPLDAPAISTHPFGVRTGDSVFYYLMSNFQFRRIHARLDDVANPESYASFTCLRAGTRYDPQAPDLDRDADGRLIWGWKPATDPIDIPRQKALIDGGHIQREEAWLHLTDVDSGLELERHYRSIGGSVFWNAFRNRWILIGGDGRGDVWYAEADTPLGPWVYATKIVQHERYSFYNVTQHPFFDQEGGRVIYFEGTYTHLWSGNVDVTPRYEYNQIMYQLSLDDERLCLPLPVYQLRDENRTVQYLMSEAVGARSSWPRVETAAFFAMPPDRKRTGLVPIYATVGMHGTRLTRQPQPSSDEVTRPHFYALPPSNAPLEAASLWQCSGRDEGGAEYPFSLSLDVERRSLQVVEPRSWTVHTWTLEDRRLDLEMEIDGERYQLTATLESGALEGTWNGVHTDEKGTWTGQRADFAWRQLASPAVTPLYEYQRDGHAVQYSTDPALDDEALQRSAEPLCSVWRSPATSTILDYTALPVR